MSSVAYPPLPIATISGHLPGCYDSCGNYRWCEDRCPAKAAWNAGGADAYYAQRKTFEGAWDAIAATTSDPEVRAKLYDAVKAIVDADRAARFSTTQTWRGGRECERASIVKWFRAEVAKASAKDSSFIMGVICGFFELVAKLIEEGAGEEDATEPTFEEIWEKTGCQYGSEALEQVRFGWELHRGRFGKIEKIGSGEEP